MKTLTIEGKKITQIPEGWRELTPAELRFICGFIDHALSAHDLQVVLTLHLSKIKLLNYPEKPVFDESSKPIFDDETADTPIDFIRLAKHPKVGVFKIKETDLDFIARQFSFLFMEKNGNQHIDSGITANVFPALRNRRMKKLHGPDGLLLNLTYMEFIRAETLYQQMKPGNNDTYHQFLAVLYRPANKHANPNHHEYGGDIRIPFNDHLLATWAKHTARLRQWQKNYIRLFYDGCRQFIINRFSNAFSGAYSTQPAQSSNLTDDFMQLSNALTQNDPTKTENLRNSLLWDVLPAFDALAKSGKKQK